jgi:hypothetical protein
MGLNPANNSDGTTWKDEKRVGVEGAEVIRTSSHTQGDNVGHVVYVKPDLLDRTLPADVAVTQTGDVTIPEEGSRVIIAFRPNERPIVLGQRYKQDETIPDFEPGERVIGHPLSESHIRLAKDGSITVKGDEGNTIELASDGSVTINGGSTKAIKNVEAGGTNSDGGITSLNITRSDDVYIP